MRVAQTILELDEALEPLRVGFELGLVPTMGALHAGHRALAQAARSECDATVLSIFVNPAQFGAGEDLERYPRPLEQDLEQARLWDVDLVFAPEPSELYPAGFQTWVEVEKLGGTLEGALRPSHFRGVATVCLKLFNLVRPQRVYFGQKDVQQVAVIERLLQDLNLNLSLRVIPTVRDPDGLAVSSRNSYLSSEQRGAALALPRALAAGARAYAQGHDPVVPARAVLDEAELRLRVDYLELARWDGRLVLVAAVQVGRTRLIDNVVLEEGEPR